MPYLFQKSKTLISTSFQIFFNNGNFPKFLDPSQFSDSFVLMKQEILKIEKMNKNLCCVAIDFFLSTLSDSSFLLSWKLLLAIFLQQNNKFTTIISLLSCWNFRCCCRCCTCSSCCGCRWGCCSGCCRCCFCRSHCEFHCSVLRCSWIFVLILVKILIIYSSY